ncbi:hypothetical protein DE146DRAFT_266334 [Phaeosphaeria sp. MPI-PUGE-AT-0046c]|nr:hypothetical protein DE146DRAFT_266334 [Phaeosphaeria sp. MPI-PUGE-AT-0046c]
MTDQDNAHQPSWYVAVDLMVAVFGIYILADGGGARSAISRNIITTSPSLPFEQTHPLSSLTTQTLVDHPLPICTLEDQPRLHSLLVRTHKIIRLFLADTDDQQIHYPAQFFSSLFAGWSFLPLIPTALPGFFLLVTLQRPDCWAARHRIYITTALHLLLRTKFTHQQINFPELVVATLVMVSFDMFQRALEWEHASGHDKSNLASSAISASETSMVRQRSVHSELPKSGLTTSLGNTEKCQTTADPHSGGLDTKFSAVDSEEGIVRLRIALTELKTANKAKDVLLRRTREELKSARETLNETFAEYCTVRDEMKNIKQSMAREHQTVVYRKDIELFALRKGNEQKEKHIMENNTKLEEVYKQQRATMELKDAQLQTLKERLAFLDRQASPKFSHDYAEAMEGDHALQVRLLKVKKTAKRAVSEGATASEPSGVLEEKDATVANLQEQLAIARKAAEEVVNQQAELSRAWDIVKKVQSTLKEERNLHAQTRERLQELTVKLEEEQQRNRTHPGGRLPTIEEDKDELESMFDKAQEDNLRLYAELEALENRLRDANSRMFNAEQEANMLRERDNAQREETKYDGSESARPSVIHHAHFQRMEGYLKENREALAARANEIELLKRTIAGKNDYVKDLQAEVDAAVSFHTQDQDEIERLKQSVAELQATKNQLMRDHERLAIQRTRTQFPSIDHASARSSGTTLIHELSPPLTKSSVENPPVETLPSISDDDEELRNNSIQETPKRHLRSESTPNRFHLMTTDVPPPELRGSRRRSLGVRDFVKKMVRKDTKSDPPFELMNPRNVETPDMATGRSALSTKDRNAAIRPATAAPKPAYHNSLHTAPVAPTTQKPVPVRRRTPRYYAASDGKAEARPQTAAGEAKVSNDDMGIASKRRSWGSGNKLKRRSLY